MSERSRLPNVVKVVECETALELLNFLNPIEGEFAEGYVFRGHARSDWRLVPSILRSRFQEDSFDGQWNANHGSWIDENLEHAYLTEFVSAADLQGISLSLEGEDQKFGKLGPATAVAQHYGLPTQLIDWTYNPYTAAYFAASGNLDERPIASGEQPSLSIWATAFSGKRSYISAMELGRQNDIYDPTRSDISYRIFLDFPYFPLAQNPNMRAQRGALMQTRIFVNHLGEEKYMKTLPPEPPGMSHRRSANFPDFSVLMPLSVDGMIEHILPTMTAVDLVKMEIWPPFYKFMLSGRQAPELLRLLERVGVHGASMFPGLAGAAKAARERVSWSRSTKV